MNEVSVFGIDEYIIETQCFLKIYFVNQLNDHQAIMKILKSCSGPIAIKVV